ncbi:lytic transglycosylase domain-containing protein [uncultured Turicimonas sp.]|uniref:lytic transglycosylase domain-containing protein n=1 Tax=uncultured Turicimonas sp. TaxID=1918607 RepID=UPI002805C798|nr:lytic transglycosylase domain-containing protein [uncultured Turicimonas sp.]
MNEGFIGERSKKALTNESQPKRKPMTVLNYQKLLLAFLAFSVIGPVFADDFGDLAKRCAPEISEDTLRALVRTESSFNPYAIGIVGGGSRQPKAFHEAMAIIAQLELEGKNYSVGLAQINKKNFSKLGINAAGALDACTNLKVASKILSECYQRAQKNSGSNSLHDALSCYYSGNFQTGYRHGYVDKVRANAGINVIQTVPSIREAETQQKESSTLVAKGDKPSTGLIF